MPVVGPRFLIEAGFIVAVAVITGIERLSTGWIIAAVAGAWVIVALVEIGVWARQAPGRPRTAPEEREPTLPEPREPAAKRPVRAERVPVEGVQRRREAPVRDRGPAEEARGRREAPVRDSGPVEGVWGNRGVPPAEAEVPPTEGQVPEPARIVAVPAPPREQEPAREPEPEPEPPRVARPEPEPEPARVVAFAPAGDGPREWNLWELERAVRDHVSDDVARNEERSYLLMYLREFAGPDGMLPADFDGLVRDAFGDVLHGVGT